MLTYIIYILGSGIIVGLIGGILFGNFVFFIIGMVIGGYWGCCAAIEDEKEEKRKRAEEEERKIQQERENKYQIWCERLGQYYKAIKVEPGFRPDNLCEPIWDMQEEAIHMQERRYIEEFNRRLEFSKEWLKNRILNNLSNRYGIEESLSSLLSLKELYKKDDHFNPAISALEEFIQSINKPINYLYFSSYGCCEISLNNLQEMNEMDIKSSEIEEQLQMKFSRLKDNSDGYFIGIVRNLKPELIQDACKLMWYYAKKKPFNVKQFNFSRSLYNKYTVRYFTNSKDKNGKLIGFVKVEEILARIYAKNQMGGMETVRQEMDYVNLWLRKNISLKNETECYILASGLAWMELYELEREILKKLVEFNVQLPADLQERFSFLENGGRSNVKIYEIEPTGDFLYDTSSIDWKAAEYEVFFRKLSMKNMQLKYSLAIQKWKKTIPLSKGQKVDQDKIYSQFVDMIEDFDGEVTCEKVTAKAINRVNEENENAILFQFNSKKNRCVSILFSSEKYGRNLNLMIITLFTPEKELNNDELKKCAMSIKDSIYVDSFKESILQEIDLVLREKKSIYDCDEEESVSAKKVFE